jgi:hypothetical protein
MNTITQYLDRTDLFATLFLVLVCLIYSALIYACAQDRAKNNG